MKFGSAKIANYSNCNLQEIPLHDSPDGICSVNLAGNRLVDVDHSAISQYSNVQYLDLSSNRITTISSLAGLNQLTVLDISSNRIRSLDFLNQLPSLKSLIAVANRIRSINLSEDLPNLLLLDLKRNPLTNLQFCLRLPNLKHIYVDGCRLSSLAGIESLDFLRGISCPENSLEQLPELSNPRLKKVDLRGNRVVSIAPLSALISLATLNLSQNPIGNAGFQLSSPIPTLKHLSLSGTKVTKCSFLADIFPNLESVDLSQTELAELDDLLRFVRRSQNLRQLDVRFAPISNGLYQQSDHCESIERYNQLFPEARVERMKFRRRILRAGGHLESLDNVAVSPLIDEEEEEEEEEEESLSCAEIISQALDAESTDDGWFLPSPDPIPHLDKTIQADLEAERRMSRAEKRRLIAALRSENERLMRQIDRMKANAQVPETATDDGALADNEDSGSEQFQSSPTPTRTDLHSIGRARAERCILRSFRCPLGSADEHSDEFSFVERWVELGFGSTLRDFRVVRRADPKAFLEREAELRDMQLAMLPCDSQSAVFDQGIGRPVVVYKQLKTFVKGLGREMVICAVDFGRQTVDRQRKQAPSVPSQDALRKRGFQSLKYYVNGVECIFVLDTTRILPLYGVVYRLS